MQSALWNEDGPRDPEIFYDDFPRKIMHDDYCHSCGEKLNAGDSVTTFYRVFSEEKLLTTDDDKEFYMCDSCANIFNTLEAKGDGCDPEGMMLDRLKEIYGD